MNRMERRACAVTGVTIKGEASRNQAEARNRVSESRLLSATRKFWAGGQAKMMRLCLGACGELGGEGKPTRTI